MALPHSPKIVRRDGPGGSFILIAYFFKRSHCFNANFDDLLASSVCIVYMSAQGTAFDPVYQVLERSTNPCVGTYKPSSTLRRSNQDAMLSG